jgi:hypothetical protein
MFLVSDGPFVFSEEHDTLAERRPALPVSHRLGRERRDERELA